MIILTGNNGRDAAPYIARPFVRQLALSFRNKPAKVMRYTVNIPALIPPLSLTELERQMNENTVSVLTINGGSSSIKISLSLYGNTMRQYLSGKIEHMDLTDTTLPFNDMTRD